MAKSEYTKPEVKELPQAESAEETPTQREAREAHFNPPKAKSPFVKYVLPSHSKRPGQTRDAIIVGEQSITHANLVVFVDGTNDDAGASFGTLWLPSIELCTEQEAKPGCYFVPKG